jgi:hypothetical protein
VAAGFRSHSFNMSQVLMMFRQALEYVSSGVDQKQLVLIVNEQSNNSCAKFVLFLLGCTKTAHLVIIKRVTVNLHCNSRLQKKAIKNRYL